MFPLLLPGGGFSTPEKVTSPDDSPAVSGITPTNNVRPEWIWDSNVKYPGHGNFRYKLNSNDLTAGATKTTAKNFTPSEDLTEGDHTLYVHEE